MPQDLRAPAALPKVEAQHVEPWPVAQVAAVIDALPRRYRTVGVAAAGCGLRQGEVFGLRVGDIDFLRTASAWSSRSRSSGAS